MAKQEEFDYINIQQDSIEHVVSSWVDNNISLSFSDYEDHRLVVADLAIDDSDLQPHAKAKPHGPEIINKSNLNVPWRREKSSDLYGNNPMQMD